jgi:hypothetical protein
MMEKLESKPIDWAWVREQFLENDTRCEFPGCEFPAYDAVTSDRLFAFVCTFHKEDSKQRFADMHQVLCVAMMEGLNARMYTVQEALSGGSVALELARRFEDGRKIEAGKKRRTQEEIRQHRKKDANVRPGTPDDGMVPAQRTRLNEARKQIVPPAGINLVGDFF